MFDLTFSIRNPSEECSFPNSITKQSKQYLEAFNFELFDYKTK